MVSMTKLCTVEESFGDQIEAIYEWEPEGKCYDRPTCLESYTGYWVAVAEDTAIICRF